MGSGLIESSFIQFGGPLIQAFAQIGRTTLSVAGATISVASLPNKKWLLILCDLRSTASLIPQLRLNNVSTGTPYADRISSNGAADTTDVSANQITMGSGSATNQFVIIFIENTSTNEKLIQAWYIDQNTAGSANSPNRSEIVAKWSDTTNAINEIDIIASASTFAIGSEVVVLGADPGDTHVTPFFSELQRTTLAVAATSISVSFTAKKYLMFDFLINRNSTDTPTLRLQFNSDTATNYANRYNQNQSEFTNSPDTGDDCWVSVGTIDYYEKWFMLNIAANEKLLIGQAIEDPITGPGTPPDNDTFADKWVNTTAQANALKLLTGAGNYGVNSQIVVYGAN